MKITPKPRYVDATTLKRWLARYEEQYDMTTEEFLTQWRAGELEENPDYIDWGMLAKALELAKK